MRRRFWGMKKGAGETCFAEWTRQVHKKVIGEVDKGYGRIEHRTYYLTTDFSRLAIADEWAGLKAIGMVRSRVTIRETETTETRYAITALTDIDAFATAMRRHWSIENGLHYCLDVSFREDHSRIRKDHTPKNMAVIRHMALSALKQLPVPKKTSLKRLRKICAYDMDLLAEAMNFILL